jgi:hypothetical protein
MAGLQVLLCAVAETHCHAFQQRPQPGARPASQAQSVFDRVTLKDRATLLGVILGSAGDEIYIACRREWMQKNDSGYARRSQAIAAQEKQAYEQLRDRLELMLADQAELSYRFVLEQELDRARRWLATEPPEPSEFVLLTLARSDIARAEPSQSAWKPLAIWSWGKQLDAPESQSPSKLQQGLEDLGVDWKGELPDLGRRFQAVPQSDEEWHARLALVRFSRAQAIEFQGTQGLMLRVEDSSKPANVATLLMQSMKNSSQSLLKELLSGSDGPSKRSRSSDHPWLKDAAAQLVNEEEDYLRATFLEMDPVAESARVDSAFAVKLPNGQWKTVWQTAVDADRTTVTEADLRRLEEDPQIQSIRQLLAPLGLATDESLRNALRMGAATMQAQQQINSRFEFFRQRYQHRLDLPILRWDVQ